MTDRRRRRAATDDNSPREENPFAPPPEDRPEQPWQPRARKDGRDGSGRQEGSGASPEGSRPEGDGHRPWGSQWSSRQPGRQGGGFGAPGGDQGGGDPGPGGPGRGRMRWDPADPMQRRARYALHSGIWALFFALFSLLPVGLLLAALSVYWGVSALRAKNRPDAAERGTSRSGKGSGRATATAEDVAGTDREGERRESGPAGAAASLPRPDISPAQAAKSQATAAIGGLVMAGLSLAVVAATFTFQQVYSEYFVCEQDALTQSSREECKRLLPEPVRPFLESGENSGGR